MQIKEVLEYEDVNLEQQPSSIMSRQEIKTESWFSRNIKLALPISSAPMATITGPEMATAMAQKGAIGVIHRFQPNQEKEVYQVTKQGFPVIGSIGIKGDVVTEAQLLQENGASGVVVDVAHGGMMEVFNVVANVRKKVPGLDVIAGNVMTAETALLLEQAGADAVRVGIGPGAVCTTRNKTGVGGGQLTAVYECAQAVHVPVIADGGIREYGDVVKALAAGASSVMIGSMFAGCPEVPEEGRIFHRGSAFPHEGEERRILPNPKSVKTILSEIDAALRSGMSYLGASTVAELPARAVFRRRIR